MSDTFRFGGGVSDTTLHPIVAFAMMVTIALIFFLPRRHVIVPFLSMLLLVPFGQQLVIGGVHVFVSRALILSGGVRLIAAKATSKNSLFAGGWNGIDKAVAACALAHATAFSLLYRDGSALVNQAGFLWDMIGGYFVLRYFIQDKDDIRRAVRTLAGVAAVIAAGMSVEQLKGVNFFGYLGAFPMSPESRDGRIRSQGPFLHCLLAGAFGGTSAPLFLWLWKEPKSKLIALAGFASSLVIAWTSACSTPIMALGAGIGALFLWPIRAQMRLLRWGIVAFLAVAAVVMKAPVWFLIAHIDLTGASSGYHRAMLVDVFIRHFSDWFLLGVKDASVWGFDMWDTCNQYVEHGESGGLIAFIFFILTISRGFSRIGTARRRFAGDPGSEWLMWILGATLFAHTMGFFGISYFDQTKFYWFAFLAMISAATSAIQKGAQPAALIPSVTIPREDPAAASREESYWEPLLRR